MTGRKSGRLTDADWSLLRALWDRPPQTMGQIVQNVRDMDPGVTWSYKTYYTYLNNLCQKEFAAYQIRNAKADRLYYPLISREQAMQMESESLLSRVSGSQLSVLLATMARSGQLSPAEQKELSELVDRLAQEKDPKG